MRKGIIIIAIILLALISSGCISLLEPSYKIRCSTGEKVSDPSLCPEETTIPPTTTPAPVITIPPPTENTPPGPGKKTLKPTITPAPTTTLPTTTPAPTTAIPPTTTPSPTTAPITTFPPTSLDISFENFDTLFGDESSLTVVQSDELWETEYKGKTVKWSGIVDDDIRVGILDDYCMYIRTVGSEKRDFQVCYEKDLRNKLLNIEKGDSVIVMAELESINRLFTNYDLNGIDIEEIQSQQAEIESEPKDLSISGGYQEQLELEGVTVQLKSKFSPFYIAPEKEIDSVELFYLNYYGPDRQTYFDIVWDYTPSDKFYTKMEIYIHNTLDEPMDFVLKLRDSRGVDYTPYIVSRYVLGISSSSETTKTVYFHPVTSGEERDFTITLVLYGKNSEDKRTYEIMW